MLRFLTVRRLALKPIVVAINMFRFNRDQGFGWIWKTADRLFEAN